MTTKRFILCPGVVRSATDSDLHHIGARRLAQLYGVPLGECLIDDVRNPVHRALTLPDLPRLHPRRDGSYVLPREDPPRRLDDGTGE